ncbi:hypothetical protein RND81_07G137700 [Saponaria officinalis]|uniref:Uncharacterized protein n=1 Tax=Saponaria officinalis TaxID=3572 RepID=A0AAW1JS93_SAPOF
MSTWLQSLSVTFAPDSFSIHVGAMSRFSFYGIHKLPIGDRVQKIYNLHQYKDNLLIWNGLRGRIIVIMLLILKNLEENLRMTITCLEKVATIFVFDPGIMWCPCKNETYEDVKKLVTTLNACKNGTYEDVKKLVTTLNEAEVPSEDVVEVVVSPPFVFLTLVKNLLRSDFHVAAQNCWVKKGGAFTNEVSAEMLVNLGIRKLAIGFMEIAKCFVQPGLDSYPLYVEAKYTLEDKGGFEEVGSDSVKLYLSRTPELWRTVENKMFERERLATARNILMTIILSTSISYHGVLHMGMEFVDSCSLLEYCLQNHNDIIDLCL